MLVDTLSACCLLVSNDINSYLVLNVRGWVRRRYGREVMSGKVRVLIADDHEQCRWVMAHLLCAECDVVAAVANGRELVDAAVSLMPDVIVSDISMPLLTGIQAMEDLSERGYEIPFVLVSTANSGAADYIKRGAMAFVNKVDMGHDLVVAVLSAALGQVCVSRSAEERRSQTLWCA
jgi:DNA-binding NarL/FixJ family response regulator